MVVRRARRCPASLAGDEEGGGGGGGGAREMGVPLVMRSIRAETTIPVRQYRVWSDVEA
jgi:hypothetical protein